MQCRRFETAAIHTYPNRRAWDAAAVEILAAVLSRWDLVPGEPFAGGYAGSVLRVTGADGSPGVLKIGYPHEEGIAEAVALGLYPVGSAPRVIKQDPWAWAMLLEEISPGIRMSDASLTTDDGLRRAGELLARISAPAELTAGETDAGIDGVPTLQEIVHDYVAIARSRHFEQLSRLEALGVVSLVGNALDELERLADSQGVISLVHGDFNPGNILKSGSDWVAIDPKPMTGDLAYDLWPLVGQLGAPFARPDPGQAITVAIEVAAHAAGCDPIRATRWSFARSGLNVTWYLEEQNLSLARRDAGELACWAHLLEAVA